MTKISAADEVLRRHKYRYSDEPYLQADDPFERAGHACAYRYGVHSGRYPQLLAGVGISRHGYFCFCPLYGLSRQTRPRSFATTPAGRPVVRKRAPAQKIIVLFIFAAFVTLIVLPPLDYRFGWSSVPWYVSVIGDALVALSFYFFYLVSKVNTYAAANVRVEEGQRVIDTGVYGLVRHPMYFGALFLIIGTPLALGSWWTLLLTSVFLLLLYFRIASEEKVLMRDLAGYAEYQQKVKYRLIPFVW
jgi:protein-S-isoprenylcysteine O-methyltransferase Ste14